MEWVSRAVQEQYHTLRKTPFRFAHLHLYPSLDDILLRKKNNDKKKVVITSGASLQFGDAKEFFLTICKNAKNLVWLLGYSHISGGSLADQLLADFVVARLRERNYSVQHWVKSRYSEVCSE